MNVIVGASGHAKDVDFVLQEINGYSSDFKIDFYVSNDGGQVQNYKIISDNEFQRFYDESNYQINCYIAIGSPVVRRKIVESVYKDLVLLRYPNAIHPSVSYDRRTGFFFLGDGNLIFPGVRITTLVTIGNQNHINQSCTIAHGSKLGDFNTLSPGVHLSGEVEIGDNVFIGTGAVILENLKICSNTVIGAGAVVIKDIIEPGTYVGMPAKKVK